MTWLHPRERRRLAAEDKPKFFPNHPEWARCMELFLNKIYARCKSEQSRRVYESTLRSFFCRDSTKTPNDYVRSDVLEFISRPTEGPSSYGTEPKSETYNGRLMKIKSFYSFATRYRVPRPTKRNPHNTRIILEAVDPTEDIRLAETHGAQKTMTDDEVARFFAVIPTNTVLGLRDRALFLFYFWCGRRRSAVLALRYGDIEKINFVEQGRIRAGWVYHYIEKGGKPGFAEIPTPVIEALDVYLAASGRKGTMTKDSPLFTSTKPRWPPSQDGPFNGKTADNTFRKYARMAGIEGHSIHSFRHTAARIRYQEERDLLKLMRFLGHSDPKITMQYLEGIIYEGDETAQKLYAKYGKL